MLLFTTPSFDGDPWPLSRSFEGNGLTINVALDADQHVVSVRPSPDDDDRIAEAVGPAGRWPGDEAVSSFHLPPYYRWQRGRFLCEFTAEWREGASSIAMSIRHMEALRRHPRSLAVDGDQGVPVSAIVIGTPNPEAEQVSVDWRGWYVLDVEDPFEGATRRILTTHTAGRFAL